jgi:hypothetical protein
VTRRHLFSGALPGWGTIGRAQFRDLRLKAERGLFILTGIAAAFFRSTASLPAAIGTFTVTGWAAAFQRALLLAAAPAAFTVSGQASVLGRHFSLGAGAGTFTFTGQDTLYTDFDLRLLIAKGTDGFWFDARNLYTGTDSQTASVIAGDLVGHAFEKSKWGGLTLAQAIAAQSELAVNGDFTSNISSWNVGGSITASHSSGEAQITGAGNPSGTGAWWFSQDMNLNRYAEYRVAFDATFISTAGTFYGQYGFNTNLTVTSAANGGVKTSYSMMAPADSAGGGTPWESVVFGASASSVWKIDNVSVKLIPGNHAVSSGVARPTLQFDGSRPLLRPDGSSDTMLVRLLAPGTSGIIGGRIKVPASVAALQVLIGGTVGTSRCFVGINTSGQLCAGLGTDAETTIVGSADLRGTSLCIWLVWDASTVKLYQDGVQVYSAAQNGAAGSDPFRLFATNNGGTAANFGGMDAYHFVAIKGYAPTIDEIALASGYLNLN